MRTKEQLKAYKHQYYLDNKERLNALHREYYKEHAKEIGEANKEYRLENKEKIKILQSQYYLTNKEKMDAINKQYHIDHPEKNKEAVKKYREKNQEKIKARSHQHYLDNQDQAKISGKAYKTKHAEKIKRQSKEYRESHKHNRNKYVRKRRVTDPLFKMTLNLRNRTTSVFSRIKTDKPANTIELLGTDYNTVKKHIEDQFTEGMTWENYGQWEIDHIVPLASTKDIDELIALCHYSNLQPLWSEDNLRKADKLDWKAKNYLVLIAKNN